jgi:hypothetical protein
MLYCVRCTVKYKPKECKVKAAAGDSVKVHYTVTASLHHSISVHAA